MTDISSLPKIESYIDVFSNPEYKEDIESVSGIFGVDVEFINDPRAIALVARDIDRETSGVATQFGRKLGTVLGQEIADKGGFAVKAKLYPGMSAEDFRGTIELAHQVRSDQPS